MSKPRRKNVEGVNQFRIIPSPFPPASLLSGLVNAADLKIADALEAMTNDRIQADAGNLYRLDKQDWVTGPGASVVMAAFTRLGHKSRFSDGSFGVYYAATDEKTAIAETVFHQERRLRETNEAPIEIDMRCYSGTIVSPLDDIRGDAYIQLQQPDLDSWPDCQRFGAERRTDDACGLLYKSVRKYGGECIAAFTPQAVASPAQSKHLRYCWNGTAIERVLSVSDIRFS